MNTDTVLFTPNACRVGSTNVTLHAMCCHAEPAMALSFETGAAGGLSVGLHGTTKEMRAFAAEVIRHADAADSACVDSMLVQISRDAIVAMGGDATKPNSRGLL